MTRNKALKVVNAVLLLVVLSQAASGFLRWQLPPEVFEWLHEGGAYVLLLVAAIHILLNWNWVKINYFKPLSKRSQA